jgi:hypothetical protein
MKPDEALRWVEEAMVPAFPLGDFKVPEGLRDRPAKGARA